MDTRKTYRISTDKEAEAAIRRGVAEGKTEQWYGDPKTTGLKLRVKQTKGKGPRGYWIYKYTGNKLAGVKNFPLGVYPAVSLKQARIKAGQYRELCERGMDPREQQARPERREPPAAPIVAELVDAWMDYKLERGDWKNENARKKEASRIKTHVLPKIGHRPVNEIGPAEIVETLRPIWNTATGDKVQIDLKEFFQWAFTVRQYRQDNPATSAQIEVAAHGTLPKKQRSKRKHPALPVSRMPELMAAIGKRYGDGYRALAFNILTALRSGIPGKLRWDWITETEGGPVLVIPAEHMKAQNNGMHMIPLSRQAAGILEEQRQELATRGYGGPLVFPGGNDAGATSAALLEALKQVNVDILSAGGRALIDEIQSIEAGHPVRVDVHGVSRSDFGTWAREHHRELGAAIDLCLHHKIDSRYEAAYNRYDYMKEKRQLLQEWADFCLNSGGSGGAS